VTQLALYLHTLRYLRPIQLRGQLLKRLRPAPPPRRLTREPQLRGGLTPIADLSPARSLARPARGFTFLNVTGGMRAEKVDWRAAGMSRLWRYNLHYFDCLRDPSLADDFKTRLIDDWIVSNPPGTPDAWDPYPLSLRIVNWIKYFLARPAGLPLARTWLTSLHCQAAWLERNFEYHLLGNHLLKNTVALLFAGAFFDGRQADGWLQRGWHGFAAEVQEQFLADGGHYERSPMYHALCLADCLDVLALLAQPPLATRIKADATVTPRIASAATFLRDLCCPDGEIPLFNDAAFGIAPTPAELFARARRVLGERLGGEFAPPPQRCQLIYKPYSGYFGFRHGRDYLLVDCGLIGPDYQPGHAHCDTLSYELTLDETRVIVDSGVYDYEAGEPRRLSRGTAGHNTVMIDGCEQSEIWSAFRVGRRARPVSATLAAAGAGCRFEGGHDGYRRLPGKPLHRRRIDYDGHGVIEVVDDISGAGSHTVSSRIRLAPGYTPVIYDRYAQVSGPDSRPVARIEFSGGVRARLERGSYFPQFGVRLDCAVLVLEVRDRLPLRLAYRIVKGSST
jgi:uncharacterized heparinase superfamily protein